MYVHFNKSDLVKVYMRFTTSYVREELKNLSHPLFSQDINWKVVLVAPMIDVFMY